MAKLPFVEVHQAFMWTCDNCGRDNFCRAVRWEGAPEEKEQMLRDIGYLEPGQSLKDLEMTPSGKVSADLFSTPIEVTCSACGDRFTTVEDTDFDELEFREIIE